MGSGADVALETADPAILRDRVTDIPAMIQLARGAMTNISQNITTALGLKAVFLITSVIGVTGLWIAILADTGATVMLPEIDPSAALDRLAEIVRGADTDRHDLAPEAAGLLAVSLGLSRMYRDDLQQLEAGMGLYDALYRWARDAQDEGHDWPAAKG